jgi:ribosome-associated translation inhibitor RaiA
MEDIHHQSMRIQVIADEFINEQARTYAEYRLFAALAQVIDTSRVQLASLRLRHVTTRRPGHNVICTIVIDRDDGDTLRLQASGPHPYAAINRGVDRLRRHVLTVRGTACHEPLLSAERRDGGAELL